MKEDEKRLNYQMERLVSDCYTSMVDVDDWMLYRTHSGNCKQCANKANCGQRKRKDEAANCEKFRPIFHKKFSKKKGKKR